MDVAPNATSIWYDRPEYASIDLFGNIYISSNYYIDYTLKFNPDGTEVTNGWHKTIGGIISIYTQDNVFIFDNTRINYFSSNGSVLWPVKNITGFTPKYAISDNAGNVYIIGEGTNLIDSYSQKDIWIKKFDPSGVEITTGWDKKIDWGHSNPENATKIIFKSNTASMGKQ